MADKSGKIVPGQVYIEVEYDYEYEAKDRKVVIKQGERYILVKKPTMTGGKSNWMRIPKHFMYQPSMLRKSPAKL